MSDIQETPTWVSNISLIDFNDPVEGGDGDAIDNRPHKELANRTAYLKKQQEATAKTLTDTIGGADNEVTLAYLLEKIENLEKRKQPYIPVGWILDTTVHYTSTVDVSKVMGYGTWQRHGEGCVNVGYSTDSDDPDWTKNMGQEYGENEVALTEEQIAEHNHRLALIRGVGGVMDISGGDDKIFVDDPTIITNVSGSQFAQGKTVSSGKSKPHNNVQRSIVVGSWVRTA